MENPADIVGLQLLWRPFSDGDEQSRAEMRLGQAWRALKDERRKLVEWIADGRVEADSAADAVYAATMRVLNNPEGLASFDRAIDDAREGGTYSQASVSNDLYFTAAELRRVTPSSEVESGAFTIRPGRSCSPRH